MPSVRYSNTVPHNMVVVHPATYHAIAEVAEKIGANEFSSEAVRFTGTLSNIDVCINSWAEVDTIHGHPAVVECLCAILGWTVDEPAGQRKKKIQ